MHDDLEKLVASNNEEALARRNASARARRASGDSFGSVLNPSESVSTQSNNAPEASARWTKMSQYWDFVDDGLTAYMEKFSQHNSSSPLDRMARVSV